MISICIPVYNRKDSIRDCIYSALAQEASINDEIEVVVQDNASTDGTWEIIAEMAHAYPRISAERNPANISMPANFNTAARRAAGDYIAFLGSDDRWNPKFLKCCMLFLRTFDPEAGAVATNYAYTTGDGVDVRVIKRNCKSQADLYPNYSSELMLRAPVSINAMVMRRSMVDRLTENGKLFVENEISFDYDLWIRMADVGIGLFYIIRPLAYIGHGGESADMARIEDSEARLLFKHRKFLKKSTGVVYRLTMLRRIYVCCKRSLKNKKFYGRTFLILLRGLL